MHKKATNGPGSLESAVQKILSSKGHQALEAWSETVSCVNGDIELLKDIHTKVAHHLTREIQSTFSDTKGSLK